MDNIRSVRLANTHFICYGPALTRLEFLLEDKGWRLGRQELFDLLAKCPALEYVSLTTACGYPDEIALDRAWTPQQSRIVVLERLETFVLEDSTPSSLHLLSGIVIPPSCDFHWTLIEPFGKLDYYEDDLARCLHFCAAVFNEKLAGADPLPVLMLEILPDFGGAHMSRKREIREWPEEIRVTLASCPTAATSQFVSRPSLRTHSLYRDLTKQPRSQRRSFAVRSRMLATSPQYPDDRWHPFVFLRPNSKKPDWVDVPEFKKVIDTFMSSATILDGVSGADTLLIPRHGYIPRRVTDWEVTLKPLAIEHLTIGSCEQEDEVNSLAEYLATRCPSDWPNPSLQSVYLSDYVKGQGGSQSQVELRRDMDWRLGDRRGCVEIEWTAPYLD